MFKAIGKLAIVALVVVVAMNYSHEFRSVAVDTGRSVRDWASQLPVDMRIKRDHERIAQTDQAIAQLVKTMAEQQGAVAQAKTALDEAQATAATNVNELVAMRDAIANGQSDKSDALAKQFDVVKESQKVLDDKRKALDERQNAMTDSIHDLDKARAQRAIYETEIAALTGTQKLIEASADAPTTKPAIAANATTQPAVAQVDAQALVHEVDAYLAAH